jgi:hypothetical protein
MAADHVLWSVERGRTPWEVVLGLGLKWDCLRDPSWNDVQVMLACELRQIWAPRLRRVA